MQGIEARLADQVPAAATAGLSRRIRRVANDLDAVWNSLQRTLRSKTHRRTLIEEIVADYDAESSEIVLLIHWKGDAPYGLRTPRRHRGR